MLFVCTANVNRSPMAAALFRAHAARVDPEVRVSSAGVMERPGHPASPHALAVMAARGLDLADHRSRTLTADALGAADVVLAMERSHLRAAAVLLPTAFARIYTLKELVRRGLEHRPRHFEEPVAQWLAVIGSARDPSDLAADDDSDTVVDPVGGTRADFERTAEELTLLVRGAIYLLYGAV